VRILRVHLEEDAGKMLHDEQGGGRESLVDLNRAGTPLLEIVSHPDLAGPEEAKAYLEEIRLLMRELGVSDCEMQEGSLRCDANEAKNGLTNDVLQTLNERKGDISAFPIPAAGLADLVREVKATGLNRQRAREVYTAMLAGGLTARQAIDQLGFKVVADEGQL